MSDTENDWDGDEFEYPAVRKAFPETGARRELQQMCLEPFRIDRIKYRGKETGFAATYVEVRTVDERLDKVFPWAWDFVLESDASEPGVKGSKSRDGVLILHTPWGARKHTDTGSEEADQERGQAKQDKGLPTDARKRCAVQVGIGRYLYYIKAEHIVPQGKHWWLPHSIVESAARAAGYEGILIPGFHSGLIGVHPDKQPPQIKNAAQTPAISREVTRSGAVTDRAVSEDPPEEQGASQGGLEQKAAPPEPVPTDREPEPAKPALSPAELKKLQGEASNECRAFFAHADNPKAAIDGTIQILKLAFGFGTIASLDAGQVTRLRDARAVGTLTLGKGASDYAPLDVVELRDQYWLRIAYLKSRGVTPEVTLDAPKARPDQFFAVLRALDAQAAPFVGG